MHVMEMVGVQGLDAVGNCLVSVLSPLIFVHSCCSALQYVARGLLQMSLPQFSNSVFFFSLGLGKKKISFWEYGSPGDFNDTIIDAFPQLSDKGGFELLWVTKPGRSLDIIQWPNDGYTAEYLKEIVRQAKIYVRPIQRPIPMPIGTSPRHVSLVLVLFVSA